MPSKEKKNLGPPLSVIKGYEISKIKCWSTLRQRPMRTFRGRVLSPFPSKNKIEDMRIFLSFGDRFGPCRQTCHWGAALFDGSIVTGNFSFFKLSNWSLGRLYIFRFLVFLPQLPSGQNFLALPLPTAKHDIHGDTKCFVRMRFG